MNCRHLVFVDSQRAARTLAPAPGPARPPRYAGQLPGVQGGQRRSRLGRSAWRSSTPCPPGRRPVPWPILHFIAGQAQQPDAVVRQVVDIAHAVHGPPSNAVQRLHHKGAALPQPEVHRPPAVAGRDAGCPGYIDVGVDVALREADPEQIAALGLGVCARPVSLLVSSCPYVAVGCYVFLLQLLEQGWLY